MPAERAARNPSPRANRPCTTPAFGRRSPRRAHRNLYLDTVSPRPCNDETGAHGMPRLGCHGRHGWLVVWFLALLAATVRPDAGRAHSELPVVRLQLQWVHQAQFAGYYVAHALGFYEREGIAIEFIQGGPPIPGAPAVDPLQMLAH